MMRRVHSPGRWNTLHSVHYSQNLIVHSKAIWTCASIIQAYTVPKTLILSKRDTATAVAIHDVGVLAGGGQMVRCACSED